LLGFPRAHGLAGQRPGEAGIVIILTMLVLFVLLIVVYQVFMTAEVELEQARQHVISARYRSLAEACSLAAQSALIIDLEDAAAADEGDEGGGDQAADPFGGAASGDDSGEDSGQGTTAEVVAETDSALDEWADPAAIAPPLGEGLSLFIEIIDEDSKINLLGLWTEDEERREEWREVFERLLDKAFEGTSLDLSTADALDLMDDLDDWVVGDRDLFGRREPPELKLTDAQDAEADAIDTDIIENEEVHFPLSLSELLMVDGLLPAHLDGFVEDGEYYPGLREMITLWSHVELKAEVVDEEDDEFFGSPLGAPQADESSSDPALARAVTSANGQINCNTALFVVLRALAPEDIPTSFLEKVIEFRDMIETVQDEIDSGVRVEWSEDDVDGEAPDLDEDDPAYYVFQEPEELFDKVAEQWDLSIFTDEEERQKFIGRLGVASEVFTIKILILDKEANRHANYRTVVWRVGDEEQPRCVVLRPLEEYSDTRRLDEDYPEALEQSGEDRFY
jgi:type II secretory pathway component PulK